MVPMRPAIPKPFPPTVGFHQHGLSSLGRSCRVFRPLTLEEAKGICLALTEPMIRESELALKASLDHDDYRVAAPPSWSESVKSGRA
jgi:hypothetical protein